MNSLIDTLIRLLDEKMYRVELADRSVHLYWQYHRETLCRQDKVNALRVYELDPDCEKCLAAVGRLVYDQMRQARIAA